MSIEANLALLPAIDEKLGLLLTILQTAQQMGQATVAAITPAAAPSPAAESTAEKKPRTKKEDDAKKDSPAAATPATTPAASPASGTQDASTASETTSDVSWAQALDAIKELNKGTKPGQGREGVLALMAHFGMKADAKVPALEALNRHAEVKAFAEAAGNAPAEDDLGI